ncbi:diguanylate cyclase [Luteimonas salinilitoris]|uniref:diguanylate cyclase n=1 Tax=Luteimonas salinilitoris TaxID=3237697 RepID=A0ABV4HKU4_9GAMM
MLNRSGRARRHDAVFAAGLAVLLCLLGAAIVGGSDRAAAVPLTVIPASEAGMGAGGALLHAGARPRQGPARLRFELPPLQPEGQSWTVWIPRVPISALWLQGRDWRSPQHGFFSSDEGEEAALSGGYLIPLPRDWQGTVELDLYVEGAAATALQPRVLRADAATRVERRAVAIAAAIYAALFTLSLLSLALYAAARDRTFLSLSTCAILALLMLAGINGHLYGMPGLRLLAGWQTHGLWMLAFLFLASWAKLVQHYVGLQGSGTVTMRSLNVAVLVLLAAAGLSLLDLRLFDPVLQPLVALGWAAVGLGNLVLLVDAGRGRLAMALPLAVVVLATLLLALLRHLADFGVVPGLAATRYGFQCGLVVLMIVFAVGLVGRISEYRDQRDYDRLAREDTERRMLREAARTDLVNALQAKLRQLAPGDIEWTAFRLLFDHLLPLLPVESMVVVAQGFHGRDLLVTHPHDQKDRLWLDLERRLLALKRQAANSIALQQPVTTPEAVAIEAMIPLQIRAPAWGAVLLQRRGGDGFTSDEMALATEFARLAQMQVEQAIAAVNLRRSAELDALTGSLNRRSIDQWLARSFVEAERDGQPLSVLFVDLDRFKSVNDRFGHACGDHCLRAAAAALRGALGGGDLFGRYGGEEFIAILPGHGGAAARQVGEELRAAVERLAVEWEGQSLRLTVSVGVATRRDRERTPAATIDRADKALYAAKRSGRNCVHVAPAVFS